MFLLLWWFYSYFNHTTKDGHATPLLVPWRGRKSWNDLGFGPPEPSDYTTDENQDSVSPEAGLGLFLQVSGNPLILLDMAGRNAHFMFAW